MLQQLWNGCLGIRLETVLTLMACANLFLVMGMATALFFPHLLGKYRSSRAIILLMYLLLLIVCNLEFTSGWTTNPADCSFVIGG